MVGYTHQRKERMIKEESAAVKCESAKSSFFENEQLHKIYKSHRGANKLDGAFIESVMAECIGLDGSSDEGSANGCGR